MIDNKQFQQFNLNAMMRTFRCRFALLMAAVVRLVDTAQFNSAFLPADIISGFCFAFQQRKEVRRRQLKPMSICSRSLIVC